MVMSLIPLELKNFEYYKRKLPLYLQNSKGFLSHFKIWFDFMVSDTNKGLVGNAELLLAMLNIFDDDYLQMLRNEGLAIDDETQSKCDFLDKLGMLHFIDRNFEVSYYNDMGVLEKKQITLNNEEFLIFIKARIVNDYCEGTFEQINGYYKSVGLPMYVITSPPPDNAIANLYFIKSPEMEDSNLYYMFLADLLTIKSMGIQYDKQIITSNILIWNRELNAQKSNGWNGGVWSGKVAETIMPQMTKASKRK